jgi:hypothetical protein
MRADEQADICQSEDGEGILVDPVHALPNLAPVGRSSGYLRRLQFHMVRPTAHRYNHVREARRLLLR